MGDRLIPRYAAEPGRRLFMAGTRRGHLTPRNLGRRGGVIRIRRLGAGRGDQSRNIRGWLAVFAELLGHSRYSRRQGDPVFTEVRHPAGKILGPEATVGNGEELRRGCLPALSRRGISRPEPDEPLAAFERRKGVVEDTEPVDDQMGKRVRVGLAERRLTSREGPLPARQAGEDRSGGAPQPPQQRDSRRRSHLILRKL